MQTHMSTSMYMYVQSFPCFLELHQILCESKVGLGYTVIILQHVQYS